MPLVRILPRERLPAAAHHPHPQLLAHPGGGGVEREAGRLIGRHAAAEPLRREVRVDVALHV